MDETNFKCSYCDHPGYTSLNSLTKHRNTKHPEHKKTMKTIKCVLPDKKIVQLGEKRLDKESVNQYRSILTNDRLHLIDGLEPATDNDVDTITSDILNVISSTAIDPMFHLMCLDPQYVKHMEFVDSIMSVSCKCFCNLLIDTKDIESHSESILNNKDQWHTHCIVKFKREIPARTVSYHFNKVYGDRGYRLKRVNDLNHFINLWVYILKRQSSKNNLKTHTHQSQGVYLKSKQTTTVTRAVQTGLPEELQDDITNAKESFMGKFKQRNKQTSILDYCPNKSIGELLSAGKIKLGSICKQYMCLFIHRPERWSHYQ